MRVSHGCLPFQREGHTSYQVPATGEVHAVQRLREDLQAGEARGVDDGIAVLVMEGAVLALGT